MGWASHHPEAYDEICISAIKDKLMNTLDKMYPENDLTEDQYTMLAEAMYGDYRYLRPAALAWAAADVTGRELDYWSQRVDKLDN